MLNCLLLHLYYVAFMFEVFSWTALKRDEILIWTFVVISSLTVSVCNKHYGMHYSSLGASLRCYKCSDYYGGRCGNVQECSYEDSCLSLHEKGGKTIRQCIRYTDCDNSRLSQMFPAVSGFTCSCCNSNLCNNGHRDMAILSLLISLLSVWWSCCC